MDDDEKKKQENTSWQEYMEEYMEEYNYQYSDFFVDEDIEETPYYQNSVVFANPFCKKCCVETLTLIEDIGQQSFLSKCPKCRTTYKTKKEGE